MTDNQGTFTFAAVVWGGLHAHFLRNAFSRRDDGISVGLYRLTGVGLYAGRDASVFGCHT
jgi:hypothetical protein